MPALRKNFLDLGLLFLGAVVTLFLILGRLGIQELQQISAGILLILLLFVIYFFSKNHNLYTQKIVGRVILFLSCFLTFVLIISSGSLNSPYLVLIHLFIFFLAIFISLSSAIFFLILSFLVFFANTFLNSIAREIFLLDPLSTVLSVITFILVVPLSIYLSKNYSLKDSLVGVLKKQVSQKEREKETLLKGIEELVFIVNKDLKIISVSESIEQVLQITKDWVIGRPLFEILFMKSSVGTVLSEQTLLLDKIFTEKTLVQIPNVSLYIKNTAQPKNIQLQIRPVVNLEAKIEQIVFILKSQNENVSKNYNSEIDLTSLITKKDLLLSQLETNLSRLDLKNELILISALERVEEDISVSQILEKGDLTLTPIKTDIAKLVHNLSLSEEKIAKSLQVKLIFDLPHFKENDIKNLLPSNNVLAVTPLDLTSIYYTASCDPKWVTFILKKLINLSLSLNSHSEEKTTVLSVDHMVSNGILIEIKTNLSKLFGDINQLLQIGQDTEEQKGSLFLNSGVEGFLAKKVADKLGIPIKVKKTGNILSFMILIKKEVVSSWVV